MLEKRRRSFEGLQAVSFGHDYNSRRLTCALSSRYDDSEGFERAMLTVCGAMCRLE